MPTEPDPGGAPRPRAGHEATADPSMLELREGTWRAGDGGEIEFSVRDGALQLNDVRPAEGWMVAEREATPEEIEVEFRRGGVEWEIEVEYRAGVLEVEVDEEITGAEPGRYEVGLAGTVEFSREPDGLRLVEAVPNEGWFFWIDEQTAEEIEITFRRDNVTWEFAAELDDGVVEVRMDFEIEGAYPR